MLITDLDYKVRIQCMINCINEEIEALEQMQTNLSPSFYRASKHELNKRKTSLLFWFPEVQESEVKNG